MLARTNFLHKHRLITIIFSPLCPRSPQTLFFDRRAIAINEKKKKNPARGVAAYPFESPRTQIPQIKLKLVDITLSRGSPDN